MNHSWTTSLEQLSEPADQCGGGTGFYGDIDIVPGLVYLVREDAHLVAACPSAEFFGILLRGSFDKYSIGFSDFGQIALQAEFILK